MNGLPFILLLGFFLGVKHALEADHIVAISTIVSEEKNPLQASVIGAFWGLGHTASLFIIGIIVLLFNVVIPPMLSVWVELIVGYMLIFLGIQTLLRQKFLIHKHTHSHNDKEHTHHHVHTKEKQLHFHHQKPFFVGIIHGLAGSGGLMILILGSIHSLLGGVLYLLLFGFGSVLGMMGMSFLLGVPFLFASKLPTLERFFAVTAGGVSIVFGTVFVFKFVAKMVTG